MVKAGYFPVRPTHLYRGRCSWPGNLCGLRGCQHLHFDSTGILTLLLFSLSRYPKERRWLSSEQPAYGNPQQSKIHVNFVAFSTSLFFFPPLQYVLLLSGMTEQWPAALTLSPTLLWGQPKLQQGGVSSPSPQLLGQSQISLQIGMGVGGVVRTSRPSAFVSVRHLPL